MVYMISDAISYTTVYLLSLYKQKSIIITLSSIFLAVEYHVPS
jgi:hypothetical protein